MKTRDLFYFCLALTLAPGLSCSPQTPEQSDQQTAAAPKNAPAQPSTPSTPPTTEPQPSADSTPSESPSPDSASEEISDGDLPDPFIPGTGSEGVQLIEPGTDLSPTQPHSAESPADVQDENANENVEKTDESATQAEPAKPKTVWPDNENKRVVMKAEVVFREGLLEMLVCLKGTKEHESILAVDTQAKLVHTLLLAAGAEEGDPVQYLPEYRPATGQEIDIQLEWKDEDGKLHRARAQEWIKNAETGEQLEHPWVFAGSQFAPDGYYLAESGDLICVANFPSATLDLPVESSESNSQLLFAAFTERIPPVGTEVTVYLTPVKPDNKDDASEPQP